MDSILQQEKDSERSETRPVVNPKIAEKRQLISLFKQQSFWSVKELSRFQFLILLSN